MAPSQAASGQPGAIPSATASATAKSIIVPKPGPTARCLSSEQIAQRLSIQWKLDNALSVVMVAPDDHLNLRAGPSAREKIVGRLAHDERGVQAVGKVCEQGRRSVWMEVKSGDLRGWANAQYLLPTTTPEDKTAAYTKLAPGPYANKEALIRALTKAKESAAPDPEVPYRVELVGEQAKGTSVAVVLHQCCYADDALSGEQVWLNLEQTNGKWQIGKAMEVNLCPRGATGKRCK